MQGQQDQQLIDSMIAVLTDKPDQTATYSGIVADMKKHQMHPSADWEFPTDAVNRVRRCAGMHHELFAPLGKDGVVKYVGRPMETK